MAEELNKDLEQEEAAENAEEAKAAQVNEASEEAAADAAGQDDAKEESKEEPKEEGKEESRKGFFKKKKDPRDEQIEELNDRVRRQMAEFENFRKRSEKEKAQMFDLGAKNVVEKILPIVDNFERGMATVPEEMKEDAFVVGMDKVYKQLMAQLEALEVKPIEAVGTEFNPDLHNAVMQIESAEYESGIVANEFQKGYTYKDQVVRHSMVAVAQ